MGGNAGDRPSPGGRSPVRALVVDADASVLWLFISFFERRGYVTAAVRQIAEARRLVEGGALFDLVVADHDPPEADALTFLSFVRERLPGAKRVAMSPLPDPDFVRAARGIADVAMFKPFFIPSFGAYLDGVFGSPSE